MTIFRRAIKGISGERVAYSNYVDPYMDDITILGRYIQKILPMDDGDFIGKRIFDIIVSVISLILMSPLLLIAAIMIKVESHGPVLYKQERIGLNRRVVDRRENNPSGARGLIIEKRLGRDRRQSYNPGKPFVMYKLRTMRNDAERRGPALAAKNDSRITRVGRLLRKARIDEIPQFINVIKGDMSIIGPRPERSFYIKSLKKDIPEFELRLKAKPGITGLAQVEAGYANSVDTMKEKLIYDLRYISRMSLIDEAKIILKTFYVIVTGKGAY